MPNRVNNPLRIKVKMKKWEKEFFLERRYFFTFTVFSLWINSTSHISLLVFMLTRTTVFAGCFKNPFYYYRKKQELFKWIVHMGIITQAQKVYNSPCARFNRPWKIKMAKRVSSLKQQKSVCQDQTLFNICS